MEKCNRKDWIAYDIIRVTKNKLATFIPRQYTQKNNKHTQKIKAINIYIFTKKCKDNNSDRRTKI